MKRRKGDAVTVDRQEKANKENRHVWEVVKKTAQVERKREEFILTAIQFNVHLRNGSNWLGWNGIMLELEF